MSDPTAPPGLGDSIRTFYTFLGAVFISSSIGCLAKMLANEETIPARKTIGCLLLSGVAGSLVAMALWDSLNSRLELLGAVSILSGIGGASTLDFLFILVRRMACKISGVDVPEPKKKDEQKPPSLDAAGAGKLDNSHGVLFHPASGGEKGSRSEDGKNDENIG